MHNYKAIKTISALKTLNNKSEDEIISILNDKETRIEILDALFNLKPQLSNADIVLTPGVKMSTYDTHGLISSHPTNKSGLDSLEEKCSSKKYGSKIVSNIICTKDSNNNPFGPSDYYMTIFEGFLYIPKAGDYDIAVDGDDAVDFACNGDIVGWYGGHGWCRCTSRHKVFHFEKPGYYKFKFRQEEMTGGDNWRLLWKKPGDNTFEVIPSMYFFYSDDIDDNIYQEQYWPIDKTTDIDNSNYVNLKNIFSYKVLKFLYENYKQDLIPLFKSKNFWQNIKKFGDNKVLDFIDEKDLCLNKESVLFGVLSKTKAINTVKDYNNVDEMNNVDKETVLQGLNPDKKIIVSTDTNKIDVAPWAIDVQNLDYENMTLDEIFWLYFPEYKNKVWNHILNSVSKYEFMSRIKNGKLVKYLSLKYGLKDVFLNKKILTPKYDSIFYGSYPVVSSFTETKELYDEKWEHNSYAVWNAEDEIKLRARPPYYGRVKGECHYEYKKIKTFEADIYLSVCGHIYIYVNDELKYNKIGLNYGPVSNMGKVSFDINDKATIKIVLDTRCWYDYAIGYLKNIKVTHF